MKTKPQTRSYSILAKVYLKLILIIAFANIFMNSIAHGDSCKRIVGREFYSESTSALMDLEVYQKNNQSLMSRRANDVLVLAGRGAFRNEEKINRNLLALVESELGITYTSQPYSHYVIKMNGKNREVKSDGNWTQIKLSKKPEAMNFQEGPIQSISNAKIALTLPVASFAKATKILVEAANRVGAYGVKIATSLATLSRPETFVMFFDAKYLENGKLEKIAKLLAIELKASGISFESSRFYHQVAGLGLGLDGYFSELSGESSAVKFSQTKLIELIQKKVIEHCSKGDAECIRLVFQSFHLDTQFSFLKH
jgi:hypothetical protein